MLISKPEQDVIRLPKSKLGLSLYYSLNSIHIEEKEAVGLTFDLCGIIICEKKVLISYYIKLKDIKMVLISHRQIRIRD